MQFDIHVLQSSGLLTLHALGPEVNEEMNENVARGNHNNAKEKLFPFQRIIMSL